MYSIRIWPEICSTIEVNQHAEKSLRGKKYTRIKVNNWYAWWFVCGIRVSILYSRTENKIIPIVIMVNYTMDQCFYKNYMKCIVSLSVQNLLFCSWFKSAPCFASSGVCANTNLILITSKEQNGAESIVYSARTVVTWSSSFTKPVF